MNSFISDYYKKLSLPLKASLWFAVSNILVRGISFITLPIFSRILSTEQYGIVSVYGSWKEIFLIVCTLTLWGGVFNVVIVKNTDQIDRIISSFQGLAVTITCIFFAVSILFIEQVSKLLDMSKILVICMFLDVFAFIPFALWSGVERYFYRYKKVMVISILLPIFNSVLGYIAVTNTQYKAEARIIVGLFLNLIVSIILFIYIQNKGKAFYDNKYWKTAFEFNVVLIPHYLSLQILSQSDRIMINNICGKSDAGIYSVAYNFAMLLQLFTSAINSSFTPWIYKKIKDESYNDIRKTTNVIVFAVAGLSIAMICALPEIFYFMLPEGYYPAIWVIPPVAVGAFFMFLYPLFGAVEFYYEENRYVTIASVVGAIVNIILNYIFINRFGYIAAAYTTLLCYILFSLAHCIFMRKILKRNKQDIHLYDIKTLAGISLLTIVFMVVITFLYKNILLRWSFVAVICLILMLNRKKLVNEARILFY